MTRGIIQGVINATIVELFHTNKEELKSYVEKLTEEQRRIGRSHLETYIKINKKRGRK